ncbi:MAG: hypothetical protein VKJ44_09500 [Synechococcus sp.]|nr:hypothetical protein [Synechococcus sp.]
MRSGPVIDVMLLPLLIAATPLPSQAFAPFMPAAATAVAVEQLSTGSVETFDPAGRAQLLARELPRVWSGSYQAYGGGPALPVQLQLDNLAALGQLVDVRGRMTIAGVETPVQGNLNAKSDQLDLLLLADTLPPGMEPGGDVMGLQGFRLSGWQPARLTSLGGRLELTPQAGPVAGPAPRLRVLPGGSI